VKIKEFILFYVDILATSSNQEDFSFDSKIATNTTKDNEQKIVHQTTDAIEKPTN
jgi:hypothetical protein